MCRIELEDNQGFGIAVDFSMPICIIIALFYDTIRKVHRTVLSIHTVGRALVRAADGLGSFIDAQIYLLLILHLKLRKLRVIKAKRNKYAFVAKELGKCEVGSK